MAKDWSDQELAAAVAAYQDMVGREQTRTRYSKKEVYRRLAVEFGRTEKAFEYRMQNISAILAEQGRNWVKGLPPAINVGNGVKVRLAGMLDAKSNETAAPDSYKRKLPAIRDWLIGVARQRAVVTYGDVMSTFGIGHRVLRHVMSLLGRQSQSLGEPIITALIVSKATGRCSDGFQKEFQVSDDSAERAKLHVFWRKSRSSFRQPRARSSLEQRAAKFSQVAVRPDQTVFRREVFMASSGKCVISGCDVPEALDAAHRLGRDWRLGHNTSEDGYLLRKDLHALYDAGLLRITSNGVVSLDPSVTHYTQFEGANISGSKN